MNSAQRTRGCPVRQRPSNAGRHAPTLLTEPDRFGMVETAPKSAWMWDVPGTRSRKVAKFPLKVLDASADGTHIDKNRIQHVLLANLAALTREFHVDMIGVRFLPVIRPWARMCDAPNLTVPDHVINAHRVRSQDNGLKQLVA